MDCEQRRGHGRLYVDGVEVGVDTYLATTVINTKVNSNTFTGRRPPSAPRKTPRLSASFVSGAGIVQVRGQVDQGMAARRDG